MTHNKAISYGAAFVIALVVLLAGLFVVVPQLEANRVARYAVGTVETANAATKARIDDLVLRLNTMDEIRDDLTELQATIPADASTAAFITQLASSAAELGVTLEEISMGQPQPPSEADATNTETETATADSFLVIPVSLSIGGSYDGVLDFIDGLRHGERLVSVTAFETAFTDEADAATVTGTISALIYVLPTESAAN